MAKVRGASERLFAAGEPPLTVRVSRSERGLIERAAGRGGLTVSAWVRRAVRRMVEAEAVADRRAEVAK